MLDGRGSRTRNLQAEIVGLKIELSSIE